MKDLTPKDKAKELVDSYINIMPCLLNQTGKLIIYHAKQCAIIAVDEILNATQWDCHIELAHSACETVEYWIEVKQEIEKL